jgi:micrococcal nuclease
MQKVDYIYKGKVTGVYDGDTITVDFDLGFFVTLKNQTIRLAEIDAAELKGKERAMGLAVRDWLRRQILNKDVVIETVKDSKETYGRWLGFVWVGDICINRKMQEDGLAPVYRKK